VASVFYLSEIYSQEGQKKKEGVGQISIWGGANGLFGRKKAFGRLLE